VRRSSRRTAAAALALIGAGAAVALLPGEGARAAIPFDLSGYDASALRFAGAADTRTGAAVAVCDVTGDGRPDTLIGAPSTTVAGVPDTGRVTIVPGSAARAAGAWSLPGRATGTAVDGAIVVDGDPDEGLAGASLDCADVDGDGVDDLVVAAPGNSTGTGGSAYVVFGGAGLAAASPVSLAALGGRGFTVRSAPDALLGWAVAGVGDLDGDGREEVAVSDDWGDARGGGYPGTVYVVGGRTTTTTVDLTDPDSTLLRVSGAADNDRLRTVAGAGDVDGDGVPDLVVGAPEHDGPHGRDSGAAYVVSGRARGAVDLGAAPGGASGIVFAIWGPEAATRTNGSRGQTGVVVAAAGDVDGDGKDDVAVRTVSGGTTVDPLRPVRDVVSVVYGKSGADAVDLDDPGTAAYDVVGLPSNGGTDAFGAAIAPLGDVDGDGRDDLAIGAPRTSPPAGDNAGAVYLAFGRAGGSDLDVAALDCRAGARLYGGAQADGLGASVAGGGALTGAEVRHLVAGAATGDHVRVVPLAPVAGACGEEPGPEPAALDVDFGFRESFRGYVFRGFSAADPAVPITAAGGATCDSNPGPAGGCDPRVRALSSDPLPRRALRWTPIGASATDGSDATVATIGTVTFRYPAHFFTLRLIDPWFKVAGGSVTVRARVDLDVAPGFAGASSTDVRVDLGTFPLTGQSRTTDQYVLWETGEGTLTDAAWAALGGGSFLGRGAVLDPLTIAIPRSLGPLPDEPTVPVPADRGPGPTDPGPRDPGTPRPPARRVPVATFTSGVRRVTVRRNTTVRLGTVLCRVERCRVAATRSVRLRVGRDARRRPRFAVVKAVAVPARLASGRRGQVRLVVSRTAARALAGRTVRVRVKVVVRGDGRPLAKTVTVTLRGARPSSKARRR
jgi:hypothetical protein